MISKIKDFFKYLESISLFVLASSITFYLLFLILPLFSLVVNILGFFEIKVNLENNYFMLNNTFSIITFIISIIFIAIRFMNALTISSDIIYQDIPPRKKLNRKILSFILTIVFVLLLVLEVIFILFVMYFIRNILKAKYLYFIHLIIIFLSTSLISSIIYKYIIPIKIKFRRTYFMSSIVSIIWYIITLIYSFITELFQRNSYIQLYGALAGVMLLMFWLYLMVVVYLLGIAFNYYYFQKISGNKVDKTVKILMNKERFKND